MLEHGALIILGGGQLALSEILIYALDEDGDVYAPTCAPPRRPPACTVPGEHWCAGVAEPGRRGRARDLGGACANARVHGHRAAGAAAAAPPKTSCFACLNPCRVWATQQLELDPEQVGRRAGPGVSVCWDGH
jgi:hypothetical protein